jgi:tryptophanyl-tRNA synthetase
MSDPAELNRLMGVGAHKARHTAAQTLADVYQRVGFVPLPAEGQ